MRNLLFVVLLACALPLAVQNLTIVSAADIQKGGAPLSSGTLCFTATEANDNPIGLRVGGGGQEVVAITNDAIGSLANSANTSLANISYRVEVFDQYTRGAQVRADSVQRRDVQLQLLCPQCELAAGWKRECVECWKSDDHRFLHRMRFRWRRLRRFDETG